MTMFTEETVSQVWMKMASLSPEKTQKLLKYMDKQQPHLCTFLMSTGQDYLKQDEREFLILMSLVIWQIFSHGTIPLATVSEPEIEKVQKINEPMFGHLEKLPEERLIKFLSVLLNNYSQREILKYISDPLFNPEDTTPVIRPESRGIALITLKSVIDCLEIQLHKEAQPPS